MGTRKEHQINKNQSMDPKMSFVVLTGAQGVLRVPQDAKVEASSLPNNVSVRKSVEKLINESNEQWQWSGGTERSP